MNVQTVVGVPMDANMVSGYFKSMVNAFFKILPIWEGQEATLGVYMRSLQLELLGCVELLNAVSEDAMIVTLASILQYLIDHPETEVSEVKREVFRAISICNKLKSRYGVPKGGDTQ